MFRINPKAKSSRKGRKRTSSLVLSKKRRKLLPLNPSEDLARRLEQMASLTTTLTETGTEFSNELTYMLGVAPRSENGVVLEQGGMQVLSKKIPKPYICARTDGERGVAAPHGCFLSSRRVLAFFLQPNKDAKILEYWNCNHHGIRRFALFFGALNIGLGIQYGGAGHEWKIGYGFLLSIILIAIIVLEALSMIRSSASTAFQMNPI